MADVSLREFYEAALSFQAKALEQSSTYNQVVILAGYAAFFAVWSAMAHDIPRWAMLTSGGTIVLSVTVYVGWTVAGMVFLKTFQEEMAAAIAKGPEDVLARVNAVEGKMLRRRGKLMKWWLPVVIVAAASGLAASVILSTEAFLSIAREPAAAVAKPFLKT